MSAEPYVKPLIVYHGGCRDGFASAWVVHHYFKTRQSDSTAAPEFVAGYYGAVQPLSLFEGRDVFIIDFSFKREAMLQILSVSKSVVVLDHHKTAQADLADLGPSIHFDMNRSGAGMAWDHFCGTIRPWHINYVEDRDLWLKALPDSDIVNAYLGTVPFTFDAWDALYENMGNRLHPQPEHIHAGVAVLAKTKQYCAEVSKNAMRVHFEGRWVPIVNAPQVDISELLHGLCQVSQDLDGVDTEIPPFAMGWWQRADGRFQYSLRSIGDFDVSALAKRHGGGGHKNAAGFEAHGPVHLRW